MRIEEIPKADRMLYVCSHRRFGLFFSDVTNNCQKPVKYFVGHAAYCAVHAKMKVRNGA